MATSSLFLNPYEQLGRFGQNVASANLGGAFRSLTYDGGPSMTPEEMKSNSQKLLGDDPGIMGAFLDVVSHPLVIAGAVMSMAYPVASAANLLNMGTRAAVLSKKMMPGMRYLSTFRDIYGRQTAAWMDQVVIRKHAMNKQAVDKIDDAITTFKKSGGVMDKASETRIGAFMDGLHNPNHKLWKDIQALPGAKSEFKGKKVLINNLNLSSQEKTLANRLNEIFTQTDLDVYKSLQGSVKYPDVLIRAGLNRMGIRRAQLGKIDHATSKPKTTLFEGFGLPQVQKLSREQAQSRYEGFLGSSDGLQSTKGLGVPGTKSFDSRILSELRNAIPDPEDLKKAGLWNDDMESAYNSLNLKRSNDIAASTFFGKKPALASYYGLSTQRAATNYVHSLANTYAWDAPLSHVSKEIMTTWSKPKFIPGSIAEARKVVKSIADKGQFNYEIEAVEGGHNVYSSRNVVGIGGESSGEIVDRIHKGQVRFSPREYLQNELPFIASKDPLKAAELKKTYIPALSGQMSLEQSMDSMAFSGVKQWGAEQIKKFPDKMISPDLKKRLVDPLMSTSGMSGHQAAGKMSGFLYGSTLGFNVVSPMKNLLQHVITTVPTIGMKDTFTGMGKALKGFGKQMKLQRTGMSGERAFTEAFPEFSKLNPEALKAQSLLDMGGLSAETASFGGKAKSAYDKFYDASLTIFTKSEQFNRLTTFYGSRAKAIRELPKGGDVLHPLTGGKLNLAKSPSQLNQIADMFAQDVTQMTQFGGGPLNSPLMLLKGPLSHPLLRQYQMFTTRVLHFGVGPAFRFGGKGGINPGTAGRAMMGSGIAYGVGKEIFDTDVSGGLLFGAMPQLGDPSNDPLGVFPFVSPALQMAGNTAKAFTQFGSGAGEELKRNIPLMVPGGIAASRLSTAAAPPLAEWLGRPYADYSRKREDGRYPVYTKKGSLQGYFSPTQLWSRAVGIGNAPGTKEAAMARFLLANRDRIRDMRRQYTEAIVLGDSGKADGLQAQYRKSFPGMGDIQVKKSDITAYQNRRDMPRLERLVETLPKELRPLYSQILALSMGHDAKSFLGIDPMMTSEPRQARNAARTPSMDGVYGVPASMQQGVQTTRQEGINRVQY